MNFSTSDSGCHFRCSERVVRKGRDQVAGPLHREVCEEENKSDGVVPHFSDVGIVHLPTTTFGLGELWVC